MLIPRRAQRSSGAETAAEATCPAGCFGFADDRTGEFAIEPRFAFVSEFKNRVAAVAVWKKDTPEGQKSFCHVGDRFDVRWGIIDMKGACIVEPIFHAEPVFHEGLAHVMLGVAALEALFGREFLKPDKLHNSTRHGFIDTTGKFVLPPTFLGASRFSEGVAAVEIRQTPASEPAWGFIDRAGAFVIEPRFSKAGIFSEGLASACPPRKGMGEVLWGYIDRDGRQVIAPVFRDAGEFRNGLAPVSLYLSNSEGRRVYKSSARFFNTYSTFVARNGALKDDARFGYISDFKVGRVSDCIYRGLMRNGIALASSLEGKYGYIDNSGNYIIPPHYDEAKDFSYGLAFVKNDQMCGYMDIEGKLEIDGREGEVRFDRGDPFQNALAFVWCEGKCGVIDLAGKPVVPIEFDLWGSHFSDGSVEIRKFLQVSTFSEKEFRVVVEPDGFLDLAAGENRAYLDQKGRFPPPPPIIKRFHQINRAIFEEHLGGCLPNMLLMIFFIFGVTRWIKDLCRLAPDSYLPTILIAFDLTAGFYFLTIWEATEFSHRNPRAAPSWLDVACPLFLAVQLIFVAACFIAKRMA